MLLDSILIPPIKPLVALIAPDIDTAEAVICPLEFNIKSELELLIVVADIPNPPISPALALIVPTISKPAADADRTVVLASVLISNASLVILTCLLDVGPIVVVEPKEADTCEPLLISTLSLSIKTLFSG